MFVTRDILWESVADEHVTLRVGSSSSDSLKREELRGNGRSFNGRSDGDNPSTKPNIPLSASTFKDMVPYTNEIINTHDPNLRQSSWSGKRGIPKRHVQPKKVKILFFHVGKAGGGIHKRYL